MNEEWNDNREQSREEPERVYIPRRQTPGPEPRPGGGSDTTALIFSILSLLLSSCLAPVALVLSAFSFRSLKKYRAAGGEWRGTAIAAALLAGLGVLFSILSVILIVMAFVTKDPNSIYGFLYHLEPFLSVAHSPTRVCAICPIICAKFVANNGFSASRQISLAFLSYLVYNKINGGL